MEVTAVHVSCTKELFESLNIKKVKLKKKNALTEEQDIKTFRARILITMVQILKYCLKQLSHVLMIGVVRTFHAKSSVTKTVIFI